ncbi:MAG: hypothetical protein ACT4TC_14310 [Myxococcaceae bacterium]
MSAVQPVRVANIPPFQGGQKLMLGFALAGAVGLGLTLLGGFMDPKRTLAAYLVAFVYWVGVAVGALLLLTAFHASNARWIVVVRRLIETLALPTLVLAPLFIPLGLGLKHLYVWVEPPGSLPEHMLHLLHHKAPYLNVPFFLIRTALYFAIWIGVAFLLYSWSRKQDGSPGNTALTLKQRRFSAGILPLLALAITFAAFDWMMSLEPTWFSTIFGAYYFAGAFLSAIAVTTLIALRGRGETLLHHTVTPEHFHSLGKLLLAFVAFWAYIAFSQFMLIWIANIPEEVTWYQSRIGPGWRPLAIALAVGHFLIPFAALLSASLKRVPKLLAAVALWCLFMHWIDLHWLVLPTLYPDAPHFHWTDLTAFVGVGGVYGAFAVFRFRGVAPVPVGDPYLAQSIGYVQP